MEGHRAGKIVARVKRKQKSESIVSAQSTKI
jgi:hypothetical protein